MSDAPREDVESWKRNPLAKLPTWAKWAVGVVGALALLVIGAFMGGSEEDTLKTELSEAQTALVQAEDAQAEAEATAARIIDQRDALLSKARSQATKIIGDARTESAQLDNKLERLHSEVDATSEELASVEESLGGAREVEAKSTIPGNGTFKWSDHR